MVMPRDDTVACVPEHTSHDGTVHANELERWIAIFMSQRDAVEDFGRSALMEKDVRPRSP
eukprot:1872598-Prorocentrum_lima.AAC.1